MSIKVKNHRVLMALLLVPYHSKLIELVCWCAVRHDDMTITSGYRFGEGSVHSMKPCRGIDLRSRGMASPGKAEDDINENWLYDPKRPFHVVNDEKVPLTCAVYHARCPHCGNDNRRPYSSKCKKCDRDIEAFWHLHLQAHSRTEKVHRDPNRVD